MDKPNRYRIHIDSMLRLTELLGKWSNEDDVVIELPYSDELDDAVCLINRLCGEELARRQKRELEHFCGEQFSKIAAYIASGEKNTEKIKSIMKETAEYYKGKK